MLTFYLLLLILFVVNTKASQTTTTTTSHSDKPQIQQSTYQTENLFERYILEQNMSNQSMQKVVLQTTAAPSIVNPITTVVEESIFCVLNSDCIYTTYCCSDYSCVHPSKCLHGQKVTIDTCDYNFECYSRCCSKNICAHFLNCYETCASNSDCSESACCSEGYCTHDVVCAGNKVIGDSCDGNTECLTRFCDSKAHQCYAGVSSSKKISIVGVVGIALSALIVLLFMTYCCKAWNAKKSSNYFSANSVNGQNGAQTGSRDKSVLGNKDKKAQFIHQQSMEDTLESEPSEEASRIEQRMLLHAATSRKLLFQTSSDVRHQVKNRTVQERYQNQVIPISEQSAENHEMTFNADSQSDSQRDQQAWLFSRGSHSESGKIFTSQDQVNQVHDSAENQATNSGGMFNSDYSNQAQHQFFLSPNKERRE